MKKTTRRGREKRDAPPLIEVEREGGGEGNHSVYLSQGEKGASMRKRKEKNADFKSPTMCRKKETKRVHAV